MRRLLALAFVASAAISAPAANAYLLNGCNSDDFVVADVVVANKQIAKVCTTENPYDILDDSVTICGLPCILK